MAQKKNTLLHRLYRDNSQAGPGRETTVRELHRLYAHAKEKYPDDLRGNRKMRLRYVAEQLAEAHPQVFKKTPAARTVHEWLVYFKLYTPKRYTWHVPDPDHSQVFALTRVTSASAVTREQYNLFRHILSYSILPDTIKQRRSFPRNARIVSKGEGASVLNVTGDGRMGSWFSGDRSAAYERRYGDRMLADIEAVVFHTGDGLETPADRQRFAQEMRESIRSIAEHYGTIDYAIRIVFVPDMILIRP